MTVRLSMTDYDYCTHLTKYTDCQEVTELMNDAVRTDPRIFVLEAKFFCHTELPLFNAVLSSGRGLNKHCGKEKR